MVKWILQDVKRTLKSRKTYLLFAIVIITILSFLANNKTVNHATESLVDTEDNHEKFLIHYDSVWREVNYLESSWPSACHFGSESALESEGCNGLEEFQSLQEQLGSLEFAGDSEEFFKLKLLILDVATDGFVEYFNESTPIFQESIKDKSLNMDEVLRIKQYVKENIHSEYEPFEYNDTFRASLERFNSRSRDILETFTFLENDYPININTRLTSGFFIANYLSDNFVILSLIIIVLIFDSYYRDYQSGVVKTILTSPTDRFRYVIVKTLSTIISSLILVTIPIVVAVIYLNFKEGFTGLDYPVYISANSLKSFKPTLEYSRVINEFKSTAEFATYKNFCSVGPISSFPADIPKASFGTEILCRDLFPVSNITVISLAQYVSYITAYFVLIIIFISAINTLFSLILDNGIYNLVIMSTVYGVGTLIVTLFIGLKILKFSPFTFLNPAKLLMGLQPHTYLNGVVVLGISIIVLNIINYVLIKKKDFAY